MDEAEQIRLRKKIENDFISILKSKINHCKNQIAQMNHDLIKVRVEMKAHQGLLEKLE